MVPRKVIENLAVSLQQTVKRIQGINTPIEYFEKALSWVDRDEEIDLATASEMQVLPLVQARLARAKKSVDRRLKPVGHEVPGMFRAFSEGSRARKLAAVFTN